MNWMKCKFEGQINEISKYCTFLGNNSTFFNNTTVYFIVVWGSNSFFNKKGGNLKSSSLCWWHQLEPFLVFELSLIITQILHWEWWQVSLSPDHKDFIIPLLMNIYNIIYIHTFYLFVLWLSLKTVKHQARLKSSWTMKKFLSYSC